MITSRQPISLWRNRAYLLLWDGQIISNIGNEVSTIAFPLLVLLVTGSPAQAGFVSALRVLVYVALVLPAGVIVDRWDRKRLMIMCDTVRTLCLVSIPVALILGHLTLVLLYSAAFLEEIFGVFFNIAEVSCLPQVVAKEQLTEAMGKVQTTAGIATLITLIVIVIAQGHHASDGTIGLIFGIGGVGGILGSLLVGTVQKRLSFAQIVISTLWLWALLWLALVVLPAPPLLALIAAAMFFTSPFYNTVYISYRLTLTPDELRGRVNSVARLIANGLSPLGIALAGISLQYLGPQITVLVSGGIQVLLSLAAMTNSAIRRA